MYLLDRANILIGLAHIEVPDSKEYSHIEQSGVCGKNISSTAAAAGVERVLSEVQVPTAANTTRNISTISTPCTSAQHCSLNNPVTQVGKNVDPNAAAHLIPSACAAGTAHLSDLSYSHSKECKINRETESVAHTRHISKPMFRKITIVCAVTVCLLIMGSMKPCKFIPIPLAFFSGKTTPAVPFSLNNNVFDENKEGGFAERKEEGDEGQATFMLLMNSSQGSKKNSTIIVQQMNILRRAIRNIRRITTRAVKSILSALGLMFN